MKRTIGGRIKRALAGLSILLCVLAFVGLAYRMYRHAALARSSSIDPTQGIDESFFAPIGGIEQWIHIRGQRRDNPIILVLHGGPGLALSPMPRDFLFSWTGDFTIALWDQRGAGKSYGRSGPVTGSVTKEQMAQDGIEVAELVRSRLRQAKVTLLGVSWGSALGVRMALARPELFAAYVGSGQSVNQGQHRRVAYEQLLSEARRQENKQALAELQANGPPPYASVSKAMVHTKWANRFEPGQLSTLALLSTVLFDSETNFTDLVNYAKGISSSQDHFRDAVETEDLPSLGTTFEMPFFVFQGALDNVTPVEPVRAYVSMISAPIKEFVVIPNAGHNVVATRSDDFLALLRSYVRPVVVRSR